jgi:phosphoribosyl 1,2-cyclic phosphodiesterase
LSLNFCILASGSSGNCSVIWTEKTAILIDCGCSAKYIVENLGSLDIALQSLTAVVITHAHMDHISASGLGLLRKNNIPIYLHEDIFRDIFRKYGKKLEECVTATFYENSRIKDIDVKYFDVYHKDTNISRAIGFSFSYVTNAKQYKVGYITDTGKICDKIIKNLVDSDILVIESNYDRMMLDDSFRPYDNKRWVISDWGHLSNEDAAGAVCEIKRLSSNKDSLKYVFLAHISEHHNTPELAMQTTRETLLKKGVDDVKILTTKRKQKCATIRIAAN